MARKTKENKTTGKKQNRKAKEIKNSASNMLRNAWFGKTISVTFFKENAWLLLIFITVVIALMGMRYKTKTKMEQIKKLEKELVQSESDKLREKAAYMSLIRETEMMRLVKKNNLGLIFQEQPPYEITLEKESNH